MDEKRRGYVNDDSTDDDHEGFFVQEESCGSCEEKGGNVACDEIVDEECCYEKSCNVNGELSENKGRYWDIWSGRWTNDKAIYNCEGWFIGWREDYSTDDDKGVFVEKECSSREEKGGRWTNDKAIYDYEGWFIGWRE
nr:hypothetical protein [Tanacetum cinerariifolium]